ncbi:hypothetical protein LWI29_009569 [Acer saccharum]|uniref:RNase H type-1 domain-containing protein n=1 Tax=Acer saccharum TaxID=4024 RepID=A0AA39RNJ8_ACESA|nr:hypothetical protein LWI29_009569 [Acer saccharum]
MKATIFAINIASKRGWHWLWLEIDSMAVFSCFSNPGFLPPLRLRNSWLHCKDLISNMRFVITHTYREGNLVVDTMANKGLNSSGFVWWDLPPCIQKQLLLDSWGVPSFRFH